jgi:hypothetical protein
MGSDGEERPQVCNCRCEVGVERSLQDKTDGVRDCSSGTAESMLLPLMSNDKQRAAELKIEDDFDGTDGGWC